LSIPHGYIMRILFRRNFAYWTQERSLTALLIYLLISILIWLPLSENNPWEEFVQDAIFNLILLAGCFSVVAPSTIKKILYLLAANAFVFRGLEFIYPLYVIQQLELLMSAMFFSMLGVLIMKYVLEDEESTAYRIQGAIIVYIIFGIFCAMLYQLIYLSDHHSFNFTTLREGEVSFAYLLYFSFTVQTTVGPGDIFPVSPWPKSIVIFQSMYGMLYPVVIIARLVTLEIEHTKQRVFKKKENDSSRAEHHIGTKKKETIE
jgi:Ion channel